MDEVVAVRDLGLVVVREMDVWDVLGLVLVIEGVYWGGRPWLSSRACSSSLTVDAELLGVCNWELLWK